MNLNFTCLQKGLPIMKPYNKELILFWRKSILTARKRMLTFITGFKNRHASVSFPNQLNKMKKFTLLWLSVISLSVAHAQSKMDFETYNPTSTLVVPEHKLTHSKFPFIDVHNHQFDMPTADLSNLIRDMDKLNMAVMVNL